MPRPDPHDARRDARGPSARLRRTARALRSGVRRYPPALLRSLIAPAATGADGGVSPAPALEEHALAAAWLGHAGVLARIGDTSIVVDPVLSDRIGPRLIGRTLGLHRLTPAPLGPGAIRGVNVLLITHAHFDHLDRPTLSAMASPDTWVITPEGCGRLIPRGFGQVDELRTGRDVASGGLTIAAIEPRHWGARRIVDRRRGVCSFLVADPESRVLFAGDTAATDAFAGLGPVDLAAFGIGAYDPWEHMHATPEQVWRMFEQADGRYLLPIHHSTFELSDEPVDEPMRRLENAAGSEGWRVLPAEPGAVVVVGAPQPERE